MCLPLCLWPIQSKADKGNLGYDSSSRVSEKGEQWDAVKSDSLSVIPEPHMVEGTDSQKLSSDLHTRTTMYAYLHYTNRYM